jgi:hypothetical protein
MDIEELEVIITKLFDQVKDNPSPSLMYIGLTYNDACYGVAGQRSAYNKILKILKEEKEKNESKG